MWAQASQVRHGAGGLLPGRLALRAAPQPPEHDERGPGPVAHEHPGGHLPTQHVGRGAGRGPLLPALRDRALKQWGDRWQRGGALSKSLPRPGDLLRQRVPPKAAFRWDSPRTALPAGQREDDQRLQLPAAAHGPVCLRRQHVLQEKRAGDVRLFHAGGYLRLRGDQPALRLHVLHQGRRGKAAGVSTLRVAKVNVWQDLVSNRLNIFFSLLEPPPVAGAGEQLSCQAAYERLSHAVQAGLTITVRHPMKQTQLHVVSDSLKRWASLDELWNKVLPGSQPAAAGRYRHDGSGGPAVPAGRAGAATRRGSWAARPSPCCCWACCWAWLASTWRCGACVRTSTSCPTSKASSPAAPTSTSC